MASPKKKKKILVIDDDTSIAIVLKEFLEHRHFSVSCATEVSDIDILLHSEKPNLIFLDYRMSPLTGKDILERVTLYSRFIPVVMMSAYRTREGDYEVKNLGAFEYISKPFNFDEIDLILKKVFA